MPSQNSTSGSRIFVKPGSKADLAARLRGLKRSAIARAEVNSSTFQPRPDLDLIDNGGRIIKDLLFVNMYVGGDGAWNPADRKNIDEKLAAAMSDPHLNNVVLQYFRGATAISSKLEQTFFLTDPLPESKSFSQTDIEALVVKLHQQGIVKTGDFTRTVFNFMLPQSVVLTIDDGQAEKREGDTDDKSSSLEGLGGFHGSVNANGTTIYYAVGVLSEGNNGIPVFDEPWKNVVATFYHELNEARTDADVETNAIAWVSQDGEEIGDIPMTLAGADLLKVMKEVPLSNGGGTVPIQLMWSNAVHAPQGPVASPPPFSTVGTAAATAAQTGGPAVPIRSLVAGHNLRLALPIAEAIATLGPLQELPGTWFGRGFNLISLPDKHDGKPFRLFMSATQEVLNFQQIGAEIPNRGSAQDDIHFLGLHYLQQVNDAQTLAALHLEPGLWLNIPATSAPQSGPTVVRQASIPHGTSLIAQGTAIPVPGGPHIAVISSIPTDDKTNQPLTGPAYLAPFTNTPPPPGIPAAAILNPNLVLQNAVQGQNITQTTVLPISTTPSGGVLNIPFVVANANITHMTAIFWIERVEQPGGKAFLQLQYTQTVILNFLGINWPHISVATLVKR